MPRSNAVAARAASMGSEGASSPFLTDDQRAALDAALAKKKAEEGASSCSCSWLKGVAIQSFQRVGWQAPCHRIVFTLPCGLAEKLPEAPVFVG